MKPSIIQKINTAPKTAGVYIFKRGSCFLYIGKASNLKARLKSYLKATNPKIKILQEETTSLQIKKLSSSIEALIEEARLIKSLKPRLNVYWQDDKNHLYVAFTKDDLPKIFITHSKFEIKNTKFSIGPFTDGKALRLILKIIRRHYPYCTCKNHHLRHCLNSQISLCPGYCCHQYYHCRHYNHKYTSKSDDRRMLKEGG